MAGVTNCTAEAQIGDKKLANCPMLRLTPIGSLEIAYCQLGYDVEYHPDDGRVTSDWCRLKRITVEIDTPPVDVDWHAEVDLD